MSKRRPTEFERRPRDNYPTPEAAVRPLLPFLDRKVRIFEPCAGEGVLAGHLRRQGFDVSETTLPPIDARTMRYASFSPWVFVTNPPWAREVLHPIIVNLSDQAPTWLLLAADFMHTRSAAPFMRRCCRIVSVGRVKWIPGSAFTSLDNCAWFHFDKPDIQDIVFHERQERAA